MSEIYKITNTKITKSKNGYTIFNLELNSKIWASKLAPVRKLDKKYDKLYQIYEKELSLNSLIGKFVTISLEKDNYGIKFNHISHYNSLEDFKKLLDESGKKAFSTDIPIYNFLKSLKYPINIDGSITLKNPYAYFNIVDKDGLTICYPNNLQSDELTFENITIIYDHFYKNVSLPPYKRNSVDVGAKSYYTISMKDVAIVRMDNHVKVSYKMTANRDYNKWIPKIILKIGDKLYKEHIEYLNSLKESNNELKSIKK